MAELRAARKTGGGEESAGSSSLLDTTSPGVLIYNGKKFAVGLLWLTIDDPNIAFSGQKELMAARRALIKPDFICERSQIIAQQGFGHLSKGHRVGMPAAAAAAADLLVGEWHGIFAADNGWWYVAVHGDAIAPDGDKFFESEEAAYQFFMEAMNRQRWPRSYAPKEWSLANTNHEISISKLLDGLPSVYLKPYTLDSLFGNAANKYLALSSLTVVIVLFTTFFATGLGDYMNAPYPPQRTIVTSLPLTIVAPPRPSNRFSENDELLEIEDYPPPVLIKACLERFEVMFKSLPGWQLTSVGCKDGNVSGEWKRQNAQFSDLAVMRRFFSNESVMTYDGQGKLLVSEPLDLSRFEKVKMQINHKELLYGILTRRLESKGEMLIEETLVTSPPPAAAPGATTAPIAPPPERFLSVRFKSPLSAYLWADDFDIPGLKPVELTWNIPESFWTLTGMVKYQ